MTLQGKVAVVTGGARGIGRGIATVLAAKGAAVAVWDLNTEGAEETVALIVKEGGTAIAVGGDAADAEAVAASAARTRNELGPVTILVNNAGTTAYEPFTSISEAAWDRMIGINLKGPFLVTRELVPDMVEAGWGRIVNISSSSAQTGAPSMAHYAASKGGVIGLTRALAVEYIEKGITVNHVPPGFIDTPLVRQGPVDVDAVAAMMPMKRAGTPEDIAHAVAYLASEEASYVTGQTLSANGGRYLA
ncbi:SDR family NAD(P)-dependent oxidoreductase [Streptomyces turgidiscabies]|uniref:Oxidoreductase, short chain dehydrogenase/reductase family protein n=1 Tax=Streptomyces turgidiscabies (strain Car8) TaxID=698760 RepID=L7F3K3_STRT8|nr:MULTISPECIES: glucose 1-dehydrogenase [Streptomyces]ELP65195.1 oxidoreductase, short chain dehydrogenase/reductase family protein [Streptomyces turgidiscabies Car8]MDX3494639.1 glucose 1-dehydrogenase [Streptomyces turgidiscabies]GAQ71246.1 3-oxoacyl-[acyl-carrier-protein] reductase FabG [Streptomyces turgidiscabies]